MSVNPYAPPTSGDAAGAPPPAADVVWFSPAQVGWATLFGTPLAAGWLLRANALAVHDDDGAKVALWGGIGGTVLLFALAFFFPTNLPSSVFGVTTALTTHSLTRTRWAQRVHADSATLTAKTSHAMIVTGLSLLAALSVGMLVGISGVLLFPDAAIWQE